MCDQPPRITIPDQLNDEAAANLVHFLQGLARVLERYYAESIARHYQRRNEDFLSLWDDNLHSDIDPPPP